MPPAFVLSQNQTLKLKTGKLRRNRPKQAGSLGAVPAQIYKLVCLRMRTFARSARQTRTEVTLRNGINLTDHPEPRGSRRPGRRPHVPSSKPTMSKSRRASAPGSFGSGCRLPTGRDTNTVAVRTGRRRCCEGAYMEEAPERQPPFSKKREASRLAPQL